MWRLPPAVARRASYFQVLALAALGLACLPFATAQLPSAPPADVVQEVTTSDEFFSAVASGRRHLLVTQHIDLALNRGSTVARFRPLDSDSKVQTLRVRPSLVPT